MKTLALVVIAVAWSLLHVSAALGQPVLPDRDANVDVGVPLWATSAVPPPGPMIIEIFEKSAVDPRKLVKREVRISNLTAFNFVFPPFVPPLPLPGENRVQYNFRTGALHQQYLANRLAAHKAAWEAASKDKADKIAAAINDQLGAGRATSTQFNNSAGHMQGRVTILNAHRVTYGQRSNTTGEVGDGVRFMPGAGGGGPNPYPYNGSMGSPGNMSMSSLGVDPGGGPSVVEFGIQGRYVAAWFPQSGETEEDVLLGLEALLDMNGLPASYNPTLRILMLDEGFGDSDILVWSMSDMGLDGALGVTFGSTAPAIPEPTSVVLLGTSGAMLGIWLWQLSPRRRRTPVDRQSI